jgi:hypothetical protein
MSSLIAVLSTVSEPDPNRIQIRLGLYGRGCASGIANPDPDPEAVGHEWENSNAGR